MSLQHELARFVTQRCEEMGLSARRLAQIAYVPPAVIESLFDARPLNLQLSIAERIATEVGLTIGFVRERPSLLPGHAVRIATLTASTGQRDLLRPETLLRALSSGVIDDDFRPHIRTLLDESSIALLARLAHEVRDDVGTPASQTWQTMRALASDLRCCREIWR